MSLSDLGKSSVIVRLGLLVTLVAFATLERNPLVRLQAVLGLSPAPLEKFLGVKNFFSGMTEGMHRLAVLDLQGAMAANIFSPVLSVLIAASILAWRVPSIDSRQNEFVLFAIFLALSVLVNIFHP